LGMRKQFGLSKRDWLGTPEKIKAMKQWHDGKKEEKELKFLRKRGRLSKSEQMPVLPDGRVERSDAQTFNDLQRDEFGSLTMKPRRRSDKKIFESKEGQIELQGLANFRKHQV